MTPLIKIFIVNLNGLYVPIGLFKNKLACNGVPVTSSQIAMEVIKRIVPKHVILKRSCVTRSAKEYAKIVTKAFNGERIDTAGLEMACPWLGKFTATVLELVSKIPRGRVASYGALAQQLSSHPRAIVAALRSNPYPVLWPCHRVVYSDGRIGGYLGGKDFSFVKKILLAKEGIIIRENRIPFKYFIPAENLSC